MKTKYMPLSKEQLRTLPETVQKDVLSVLRAYNECNVIYENGKYNVSAGIALTKTYANDHRFIGVAYADDIYTIEERTQNYIEVFHDYPIWYKGKRDYVALKAKYGEPPIFD